MVHHIKDESDFKAKLKEAGDKLVVVDFFADWCNICKMLGAELEDMSKQKTDVVVLKVNVQECESVAMEFSVSVLPTIVFIKKGETLASLIGSKNVHRLEELTNKYNGKQASSLNKSTGSKTK